MRKLTIVGMLALMATVADAREAETLYNQSCIACHASGAAGAPKTGDAAAWKARADEKGMDKLVANARDGIGAMPPKGMCMDCTDEEFKGLIEFMSVAK